MNINKFSFVVVFLVLASVALAQAPTPTPSPSPAPDESAKPLRKLRVSQSVMEGNLIHKIEPRYPQMARIAHIQGDVLLTTIIDKQGDVKNLRAVSGHPILIQAALDAVRQWKYKPYLLNGEPVEIETTITIKFHM